MKKLLLAMTIVASCAASATDITVPFTSPNGGKYTYHIDSTTAHKVDTSGGPVWSAKVTIEDADNILIVAANVVIDGCDLAAPAGSAAIVDGDGELVQGTAITTWALAAFVAKKGNVVDAISSYTCIAAMANELAAAKKKTSLNSNTMEYFMKNI